MRDMKMMERVAPCGLDCETCPVYEDNITQKTRAYLAGLLHLLPESVSCKGCRPSKGSPLPCPACETYACAAEHGVRLCLECPDFPCGKLMPVADGANRFPHNTKLYNLGRIGLLGMDRWLEEAEADRELYFSGKLVLGKGPVPEEEKQKV